MYDKKKQEKELSRLRKKLSWAQMQEIGAMEGVTGQTVYNYLENGPKIGALAAAIIERGNSIVNQKNDKK